MAEAIRKRVSLGLTINLGNYETMRVDVMAEADAKPDEDGPALLERLAVEAAGDLTLVTKEVKDNLDEIKGE